MAEKPASITLKARPRGRPEEEAAMQQFIPFEDQWDELSTLVPYPAGPDGVTPLPLPVRPAAATRCGSRYEEEDLFAGWPDAA
jgi:hypothetical protein